MASVTFHRAAQGHVYHGTDVPVSCLLASVIPRDTAQGTLVTSEGQATLSIDGGPARQLAGPIAGHLASHYNELDIDTELEGDN
jgi:hypothetical protein